MRCQTVVLSISRFCSRFPVGRSEKSGDSSIKIFHRNKQQNKKIKKRCFFASHDSRRQSRFFAKKYYPRGVEIFFQKPEGLDLDGLGNQG